MAKVRLSIGGHSYELACRAGEEAHYAALAARLDAKAMQAKEALGGMNEVRQLLLAGLLLADEIESAEARGSAAPADASIAASIDAMAERLERLAEGLEKASPAP